MDIIKNIQHKLDKLDPSNYQHKKTLENISAELNGLIKALNINAKKQKGIPLDFLNFMNLFYGKNPVQSISFNEVLNNYHAYCLLHNKPCQTIAKQALSRFLKQNNWVVSRNSKTNTAVLKTELLPVEDQLYLFYYSHGNKQPIPTLTQVFKNYKNFCKNILKQKPLVKDKITFEKIIILRKYHIEYT